MRKETILVQGEYITCVELMDLGIMELRNENLFLLILGMEKEEVPL